MRCRPSSISSTFFILVIASSCVPGAARLPVCLGVVGVLDSVSPSADSVLGKDFLFLAVFFVKAACRTFWPVIEGEDISEASGRGVDAGVGEDGLDEVTLAVFAALLFEAAVVFFGVQKPVVVAPVACFSFSSFP